MDLIPATPSATPSYWCTWGAQNYACDQETYRQAIGIGGHAFPSRNLDEQALFGPGGWGHAFAPIRRDLLMLYDVGWDLPSAFDFADHGQLGSLEPDEGKFPSCRGTPAQRLRGLVELTRAHGWKGVGLWIAAHPHRDRVSGRSLDDYYRERWGWFAEAGVAYAKVDYGGRAHDARFRRQLTAWGREMAPGLVIEHARSGAPTNDLPCPWDETEPSGANAFAAWKDGGPRAFARELVGFSDVFRSYDVISHLSVPTTLDRVAELLDVTCSGAGLINCEDEPYLAAGLGLAIGIMRHPSWLEFGGDDYDPWCARRSIDAVVRAVRWSRIAPALGSGRLPVARDGARLVDRRVMRPGDSWAKWFDGQEVAQGAPARLARGMPLPRVDATGERPYVACIRHPHGPTAVAALPRLDAAGEPSHPRAAVAVRIADPLAPVGVFGRLDSLRLRGAWPPGVRWWAQDLAGGNAEDITAAVRTADDGVVVDGALLERIGLSAATPGDRSEPGLVLQARQPG